MDHHQSQHMPPPQGFVGPPGQQMVGQQPPPHLQHQPQQQQQQQQHPHQHQHPHHDLGHPHQLPQHHPARGMSPPPMAHPQHQQQQQPPQQGPFPQLPPQMFTTAAQLLDLTDKKLLVVLRDGKKLIGVLRSWDQFGNIVLQNSVERTFAGTMYADISRGLFVIRGENVMFLGEIDLDRDDEVPPGFTAGTVQEVLALQAKEEEERKHREKIKTVKLKAYGFEGDKAEGLI